MINAALVCKVADVAAHAVFWVESALALNPILTLGLGPLFLKYLRPLAGSCLHADPWL